MKRAWIRSSLFNIVFLSVNLVCCIALLPTLLLPRKYYLIAIELYHFLLVALEYLILGLKYEIRGEEHVPENGAYLVAAKHMSAYETFKLRLLFDDPAIILKKELLKIPLWGAYLKKSDVIAIDRSTPEKAIQSIKDGAVRMKEAGRPIIIFPQGTRVKPNETTKTKPYKSGIFRIQKATDLPIIPMATNSGIFWPKSGWFKSSGTVVFKFMPPIPVGKGKDALMKDIEEQLETESLSLMNEARLDNASRKGKALITLILLALIAAGLYSYGWFESARAAQERYVEFITDLKRSNVISPVTISGFPGPIKLDVLTETIESNALTAEIKVIHAEGWPLPFMPITVRTGPIILKTPDWQETINVQSTELIFSTTPEKVITIHNGLIRQEEFEAQISGTVDLKQRPVPKLNLNLGLKNYASLLNTLAEKNIIENRIAMFLGFGFSQLEGEDGIVRVPFYQQGKKLYAGPLPIVDLPELFEQEASQDQLPRLEPYNQLGPAQ